MRAASGWVLGAMLLAASVLAEETDAARAHFETGRLAFESNDLERALTEFEAARAAGLAGPAVDYNIGVAAYRLGRFDVAEQAFRRVARTPEMAGLAHYNLGLVALRRGRAQEAAHWFRLTSRAGDQSLRALADAQLAGPELAAARRTRVGRYVSLSAGYDENVALVADADLIDQSGLGDAFVRAQFAIVGPLDRALRFDAAILHTNYADLDRYDELTLGAGARYAWASGSWGYELEAGAGYATLDAEGFERRGTIAFHTRRELAAGWSAGARYRISEVDGLAGFESLGGTRHSLGVRAERTTDRLVGRLDYAFESSDLADPLLSSDRHVLGGELRSRPHGRWELAANVSYRLADYAEASNGSRSEDHTLLGLELTQRLGETWRAFIRYEHLINESSDAQFDFDASRGSLGASAFW